MIKSNIAEHYDKLALYRDDYIEKHKYYYSLSSKQYKYMIPSGRKVLEIGCSTGHLLNELKPSVGYGVDLSGEMISVAEKKYPGLFFYEGEVFDLDTEQKFDYIVLSNVLGDVEDVQALFVGLRRFCTKDTRIVIEYHSALWQYVLKLGEIFKLRMPQRTQNWLTYKDICNLLKLSGFEMIATDRCTLFPFYIKWVSSFLNRFVARLPVFNALTLNHFMVARPLIEKEDEYSVTILVPCRNEKGNIEQAITRTPSFGSSQEFVFVEGGSSDGTYEEVQRVIEAYPDKDIKLFRQQGKGKGDAVRLGFSKASCDVLMILDADLTVAPEDLPKFYDAIRYNHGEFINGCRLVYPMEKEAMRFLNMIANKFFSMFFTWLLGQTFKDTLCGTKVLFKNQYDQIVDNRSYFGDFDPFGDFDLIFGATKLNLKVVEVPVRYKSRTYGSTQIQRFRHGILLFQMCYVAMKKIRFK